MNLLSNSIARSIIKILKKNTQMKCKVNSRFKNAFILEYWNCNKNKKTDIKKIPNVSSALSY
jgi:hypothetical protein